MITAGRHTVIPEDMNTFVPVYIGSFTSIASGLTIVSGQHPPVKHPLVVSTFPFTEWNWGDGHYPASKMDGNVTIGSDVWIGQDVTILDEVHIGDGAIIGAGAVVTKSVPPYKVVAGNPAIIISRRFNPITVDRLLRIQWWNWTDTKIQEALPHMRDITKFLERYDT